jgi:ATP-dependent Lhr-like helicase
LISVVRAHLDVSPPATAAELSLATGLRAPAIRSALARLEHEGSAMRVPVAGGEDDEPAERYCARRLLARAFAASRDQRRRGIEAVPAQTFVRFLLEWQHVAPGTGLQGPGGLAEVVEQLQGFEAPIGAFEESILPKRVGSYQASLLDGLCLSGEITWGRLTPRQGDTRDNGDAVPARRPGAAPSRSTPVSLMRREDLGWLLRAVRGGSEPVEPAVGAAQEVVDALRERGALFFHDLSTQTGRLPGDVAEAVWDGVARGLVTADGFQAVRSLLSGRYRAAEGGSSAGRWSRPDRPGSRRPGVPARSLRPALSGGRWSLIASPAGAELDADELAEAVAGQLLLRWGVIVRELMARESFSLPWRDVLFALRRFEARGVALGGRFVAGFAGEQFALPEAADHLRAVQRRKPDGTLVTLSAADPLNIAGILTAGPRIPAVRQSRIELLDGVPVRPDASASAPPPRLRELEHAPSA